MSLLQVGLIENPHSLIEMVPDIFVLFAQNYSTGGEKNVKPPPNLKVL